MSRVNFEDDIVSFRCPGCKRMHRMNTDPEISPAWVFNGNLDLPTLTPSILFRMPPIVECCHSFVTNGRIHFLDDCSHELKGQTVDLPEIDK